MKAFDTGQALESLREFEAFVGSKFVNETAGFYRHRMKTAANDIDRLCRSEALHPLARALSDYLTLRTVAERQPTVPLPDHVAQLAADASAIFRFRTAWAESPSANTKYLLKRIKSKHDSMQCLYEFRMASFLELEGIEVLLRSGTPHRGHDLEAVIAGTEVEVECKYTYPWSGRKIHHPAFNKLYNGVCRLLSPPNFPAVSISVICDDRLRDNDADDLATAACEMTLTGGERRNVLDRYQMDVKVLGNRPYKLSNEDFDSEFRSVQQVRPHVHIGFFGSRNARNTFVSLVLVAKSRKSDDVIANFVHTVVLAERQLSGTRPGIVSIHLPEQVPVSTVPDADFPLGRAFGAAAKRGKFRKVGMAFLTTEGNFVEDGLIKFGGQLIGMRNSWALLAIPEGFPGTFSK